MGTVWVYIRHIGTMTRIYFWLRVIISGCIGLDQPKSLPDQYQYSNRLIVACKEEREEYLDEKIALAVNGILDDFEGLAIVYMEIDSIFHL